MIGEVSAGDDVVYRRINQERTIVDDTPRYKDDDTAIYWIELGGLCSLHNLLES
jgi:hypothetical protein